MDRGIRSPSEPEHRYDQGPTGDDTQLKPLFGLGHLWGELVSVFEVSRFDHRDESSSSVPSEFI
jgi:hypothetical protein